MTSSACNCINGVCGAGASSVCACSAGWGKATNGTQCAVCATGYFQSLSGDCLGERDSLPFTSIHLTRIRQLATLPASRVPARPAHV